MLNQIVLMGRLVRDPELRYTQNQVPVASFRIAVDRDYAGRDGGERQTDFIDIVAWRKTGEFVSKYFTKGSMIIVSGSLQMREWTDRDNQKRITAEVQAEHVWFGETKRSRDEYAASSGGYRGQSQPQNYGGGQAPAYGGGGQAPAYGNQAPAYGGGQAAPAPGGNPAPARGGQSYGNDYAGFDDMPGESAFSELSDADGDLPF